MKRKHVLVSLALAFALCLGAFSSAFAAIEPFITFDDVPENEVEMVAVALYDQAMTGGYKLVDTDSLKSSIDKGEAMLIVDAMPANSYKAHHISGAINAVAPMTLKEFSATDKAVLLDQVKAYSGKKTVSTKYYWNSKKKKWVTKKPAKKYYKKCSKKKDKHYGKKTWTKKTTVDVKNKKIVCYCGFTTCLRSDVAAAYLVSQGYTNVYRYPGGLSAWDDAGNEFDTSLAE